MLFEKPQKGNPHRITVNQHVFPRASIARFVNDNNCVSVFYIPTGKAFIVAPDNELFCAKRAWDQRAEEGYMQRIERDFQKLVKDIIFQLRVLIFK